MKALVYHGPRDLRLEQVPVPVPKPGEVRLKIMATGICGSDVHGYLGITGRRIPPMIMGHEGAGVVAGLGKGVENLKVGDKVGLNPLWGCGQCDSCVNGNPNMCMSWRHLGITCDGTFAEYRAVPAFTAYKLPGSISMVDALLQEARKTQAGHLADNTG